MLLVLWSLVLLTLITTRLVAGGRDDARLAFNLRSAAEAEMLADAAVHEALFRLLNPSDTGWPADGSVRSFNLPGGTVRLRIADQSGLVNPNQAGEALLQALLRGVGADSGTARSVAAAIMDWRFPGAQARPFGAKAPEYQAAGLGYAPPEAPFQSVNEVGLVLGMTPSLLARLAPHLTVFYVGDPNPAAADPVVLQALRQATEQIPAGAARQAAEQTVAVTADARSRSGGRFVREAVLRVGAVGQGRLYTVLDWRRGRP